MADFRKCIPALVVLVLILGLTSTASAQNAFTCVANTATPNQLRYEGLTELVGDLVITCTGGVPTPPNVNIPQVNITVFMGNTTVTSRLLSTASGISEALLMLDEPIPPVGSRRPQDEDNLNPQTLCSSTTGCTGVGNGLGGFAGLTLGGRPTFNYYGTGAGLHPNMFHGLINTSVQPNAVSWLGIPVDPPGTNGTRTIRITNIRINANAIGTPSPTAPPIQAVAFISAFPSSSLPITNNAQQVVGLVQRGLTVEVSDPAAFQQCVGQDDALAGTISFAEVFASAFKVKMTAANPSTSPLGFQDIPGANYGTESGFYSVATGGQSVGAAGVADFGTRVKVAFNNVPLDVEISIPDVVVSGSLIAVRVASETSASAFGAPVVLPPTRSTLTMTTAGGVQSGAAVYEIVSTNTQSPESLDIVVGVTFDADPGAGTPGLGAATVNGWFAPSYLPTNNDAKLAQPGTWPIPRFVDLSSPIDLFEIRVCATNLLFPFVTNQVGFDTGLAIANTSEDTPVFDTTPQTGVCTLYSYGDNAPAAVVSPDIAGGTVWTALASAAMPNFQGYVIASCTFQFAHGFAFVSDLGARNLAMGYLALVIPDQATRQPGPHGAVGDSRGEQLSQ